MTTPTKSDTARAVLKSIIENPLGSIALGSAIIAATSTYYSLNNDMARVRYDIQTAIERAQTINSKQDQQLDDLRGRIARTEGVFIELQKAINDMKSDVREITTNLRWLIRERDPKRGEGGSP